MMNELEAILGGDLVTMVFLYGSAVMLIVSMIVVIWLCETRRSHEAERTRQAAFLQVASHRN
jgi:hypothetical protein